MREKELRLALVCFGGISLAVYMHGISKEILKLVRASRTLHRIAGRGRRESTRFDDPHPADDPEYDAEAVYLDLLRGIGRRVELRAIVDSGRPQIARLVLALAESAVEGPFSVTQIHAWREAANARAAQDAGFAYQGYVRLKLDSVRSYVARLIASICGLRERSLGGGRRSTQSSRPARNGAASSTPRARPLRSTAMTARARCRRGSSSSSHSTWSSASGA